MLHELAHNARGPHDAQFYKLWDELRKVRMFMFVLLCCCLYIQSFGIRCLCARVYKNAEIVHIPLQPSTFTESLVQLILGLTAFNLKFSLDPVVINNMQMELILFSKLWLILISMSRSRSM